MSDVTYTPEPHGSYALYKISPSKGRLPEALKGFYTSEREASFAITLYKEKQKKPQEDSKKEALELDEVFEEDATSSNN